jgi:hypothetical protein
MIMSQAVELCRAAEMPALHRSNSHLSVCIDTLGRASFVAGLTTRNAFMRNDSLAAHAARKSRSAKDARRMTRIMRRG